MKRPRLPESRRVTLAELEAATEPRPGESLLTYLLRLVWGAWWATASKLLGRNGAAAVVCGAVLLGTGLGLLLSLSFP